MKAFTDISQSKKLAEILPLESADMCYSNDGTAIKIDANPYTVRYSMWKDCVVEIMPCWGLSALLNVLPYPSLHKTFAGWRCDSYDKEGKTCKLGENADNPIDACVAMVEKLHKLNLL